MDWRWTKLKDTRKELAMQRIKVLQETKEKLTNDINYLLNFPSQDKMTSQKCKEFYKKLDDAFDDAIVSEANIIIETCEGVKRWSLN